MSTLIHPQTTVIDGLSIRFAEGGAGSQHALLLSPWPESLFAFEPVWSRLTEVAHAVAVDLPGFGGSERREQLMNPKAMGAFIIRIADTFGGDKFADGIPYVHAYPEQLPLPGTLLPEIRTPVRIVQGSEDQVVPAENAHYLGERLLNSSVDLIAGAGHFVWEERPEAYASMVTDWWDRPTKA